MSGLLIALLSGLGAALVGGAGSIIGNIINKKSVEQTNKSNEEINQKNLDYNAHQTQEQWERDDTAHQREVADLQAAGLSPLANVNGANTSQALGAPSPIAMQAPQVDVSGLINSVLQNKALNETQRHNKVEEGQTDIELDQRAEEIQIKAQQLNIENKQVENTFKYQSNYIKYLSESLGEVQRHNKSDESLKRLQQESEEYYKAINSQTHGKSNYKIYTNVDEYSAALKTWSNKFEVFITSFISETSASISSSNSSSKSSGASAGLSGSGAGFGAGLNGSGTKSNSSSSSGASSYNVSQRQQAELERWYAANPMPVYYKSRYE